MFEFQTRNQSGHRTPLKKIQREVMIETLLIEQR